MKKKSRVWITQPSKRQAEILEFITKFQKKKRYSPSLAEMAKHFRTSIPTVHEHIAYLREKNLLSAEKGRRRSLDVIEHEVMVKIPLLGTIAAGQPIEAIQERETIAIPKSKIPRSSEVYALRVVGNSMIDENINDGDVVLVRKQATAENGQKVVALIDNHEATLKRFYKERGHIRLQPANKSMEPIILDKDVPLVIQGIVLHIIKCRW